MMFLSRSAPARRRSPVPARSPRAQARWLQQTVEGCRRLLSERGESNSVAIAEEVLALYAGLTAEQRLAFFKVLDSEFGPDPQAVLDAAQRYAEEPEATRLMALIQAAEPPRQELLRRLNRASGGTAVIVGMRRTLLELLKNQPGLAAVEADFLHLLSSWFNPGFLQMEQVDWRSPAALLEKIIQHEAVHEIDGWADLRRRLQPDRRCFAFFHPQLPGEPLIFVEVALVSEMPAAVGPLIDVRSEPQTDERQYKVATFYSISNCQPGLKGVSLGNFLIKRVAEHLQREFPQLRTFCTLSPIPGFTTWLHRHAPGLREREDLPPKLKERVLKALAALVQHGGEPAALAGLEPVQAGEPLREAISTLAAFYLAHESVTPRGDPVAKFHLGNGARLERLNWAGDLSRKGLKQSLGLMVNYLYDLRQIEDHHERFVHGEVVASRALQRML
ncbi:MAG: malonyl-CoA decarboxylase [Caldimonas sp.]|uniref:malonyl-CoA decarboxylase n=1 Tax=Caldimonas sp. TaxID=2838790 RepID=UPI00391C01C2